MTWTKKMLMVAVLLSLIRGCMGQTICVAFPRGHSAEAVSTRKAVADWLEAKGYATADCYSNPSVAYDFQLWFYPYWGVQEGDTYFVAQAYGGGNVVAGSVGTYQEPVRVNAWSFTLWPKGEDRSVYRDEKAASIDDGLKRLDKTLRKVRKRLAKEGR